MEVNSSRMVVDVSRPKSRKLIRMTRAVLSSNKHQGQKLTSRAYPVLFPATCIGIWHRRLLHLQMTWPFLLTEHDFVMQHPFESTHQKIIFYVLLLHSFLNTQTHTNTRLHPSIFFHNLSFYTFNYFFPFFLFRFSFFLK